MRDGICQYRKVKCGKAHIFRLFDGWIVGWIDGGTKKVRQAGVGGEKVAQWFASTPEQAQIGTVRRGGDCRRAPGETGAADGLTCGDAARAYGLVPNHGTSADTHPTGTLGVYVL